MDGKGTQMNKAMQSPNPTSGQSAKKALSIYHPKVPFHAVDLSALDSGAGLESIVLEMRHKIELGRDYSFVAAAVLTEQLRQETLATLSNQKCSTDESIALLSKPMSEKAQLPLKDYVSFGVELGHLTPRLMTLDLDWLGSCLDHSRSYLFDYLGAHTLYDRYLLHKEGQRYESLQHFWMRVSMGVALAESSAADANARAKEFYDCVSQMLYVPSTPTLFNAGTVRSQMSSCFLTTTQDDLVDIYRQYADNALLSKFAGGLGNDWTQIRAQGSWIKGTNGKSQGVIPFLKVQDSSTVAVNQGGKRKGAVCAYLETWHLDIEDFLELRKNTGDERRRTHDMNTANWVPDLFLKRVEADGQWTLLCPSECEDLHETFGAEFEKRYVGYEAQCDEGKIQNWKRVSAVQIWRKMLTMLFETGHPWITFKDPCNLRSPQQHAGVVHSSNLCTEITLNTSREETAVCNIGSVNLKNVFAQKNPAEALASTVKTAMRILDNVITENYYPIESARTANDKHRPVGLGLMGFQDVLYKLKVPYSKPEAVYLSSKIMEFISFHSVQASHELSVERGSYQSFTGSLWSQGVLPQDSLKFMGTHYRPVEIPQKFSTLSGEVKSCHTLLQPLGFAETLDWTSLRQQVTKGMRNSLCMAIAPTATISNIAGCTQSIEPSYKNLFVKSNLGGEYTVVNEYLIDDLKALKIWNSNFAKELKRADGSISNFDLPSDLKELYQTAFDVEPEQLIRCASARQSYIDQAQSLNLYLAQPSGRRLDEMYRYAWHAGLKTTYYLRSKGASGVEKSSLKSGATTIPNAETGAPGMQTAQETQAAFALAMAGVNSVAAKACSIENPECEACQ
jgi:ribonucleoside-diphosphate reductase alpha chain